jgi:hypothetical protein
MVFSGLVSNHFQRKTQKSRRQWPTSKMDREALCGGFAFSEPFFGFLFFVPSGLETNYAGTVPVLIVSFY